jgi:para-nitrobenzyl esterase
MAERPRLETRSGILEGRLEAGVRVFRGVPFAAPPVGARRWAAPARERPWPGARDASRPGPAAPQRPSVLMRMLGMENLAQDEDCLTLNVWTPADPGAPDADRGKRPILVWLHGGAFTAGSGSMSVFDGGPLARRGDVLVVTPNYRLGVLGFGVLPALLDAGETGANFGLLDQIAALGWVREHAERLGGDPDQVTLFGESAGAMSIGALLAAPAARGLFQRAILQSGAAHNVSCRDDGLRVAELFASALDAPGGRLDPAALRALPVEALLAGQQQVADQSWRHVEGLAFQPVCEGAAAGAVLPRQPLAVLGSGDAGEVSLLAGTNLDEWRLFALADTRLATADDEGLVRRLLRNPVRGVAAMEPFARHLVAGYRAAREARGPTTSAEIWLALQGDRAFRMPAIRLLERAQPGPDFAYLFTWASPALDGRLGACHALEVPFVFGTVADPATASLVGAGPAAARLSARMQEAWIAFARSGDPGWPAYDETKRTTAILGAECAIESDPFGAERRLWDGVS